MTVDEPRNNKKPGTAKPTQQRHHGPREPPILHPLNKCTVPLKLPSIRQRGRLEKERKANTFRPKLKPEIALLQAPTCSFGVFDKTADRTHYPRHKPLSYQSKFVKKLTPAQAVEAKINNKLTNQAGPQDSYEERKRKKERAHKMSIPGLVLPMTSVMGEQEQLDV